MAKKIEQLTENLVYNIDIISKIIEKNDNNEDNMSSKDIIKIKKEIDSINNIKIEIKDEIKTEKINEIEKIYVINNKNLLFKTLKNYAEIEIKSMDEINIEKNSTLIEIKNIILQIQISNLQIGKKWNKQKKEDEIYYTEENDEPIINYILLLLLTNQLNDNGIEFIMKLLDQKQNNVLKKNSPKLKKNSSKLKKNSPKLKKNSLKLKKNSPKLKKNSPKLNDLIKYINLLLKKNNNNNIDEILDSIKLGLDIFELGNKIINLKNDPITIFKTYLINNNYLLNLNNNEDIKDDNTFEKIKNLLIISNSIYEQGKLESLFDITNINDAIIMKYEDIKKDNLSDPVYNLIEFIKITMNDDTHENIEKRKLFFTEQAKILGISVEDNFFMKNYVNNLYKQKNQPIYLTIVQSKVFRIVMTLFVICMYTYNLMKKMNEKNTTGIVNEYYVKLFKQFIRIFEKTSIAVVLTNGFNIPMDFSINILFGLLGVLPDTFNMNISVLSNNYVGSLAVDYFHYWYCNILDNYVPVIIANFLDSKVGFNDFFTAVNKPTRVKQKIEAIKKEIEKNDKEITEIVKDTNNIQNLTIKNGLVTVNNKPQDEKKIIQSIEKKIKNNEEEYRSKIQENNNNNSNIITDMVLFGSLLLFSPNDAFICLNHESLLAVATSLGGTFGYSKFNTLQSSIIGSIGGATVATAVSQITGNIDNTVLTKTITNVQLNLLTTNKNTDGTTTFVMHKKQMTFFGNIQIFINPITFLSTYTALTVYTGATLLLPVASVVTIAGALTNVIINETDKKQTKDSETIIYTGNLEEDIKTMKTDLGSIEKKIKAELEEQIKIATNEKNKIQDQINDVNLLFEEFGSKYLSNPTYEIKIAEWNHYMINNITKLLELDKEGIDNELNKVKQKELSRLKKFENIFKNWIQDKNILTHIVNNNIFPEVEGESLEEIKKYFFYYCADYSNSKKKYFQTYANFIEYNLLGNYDIITLVNEIIKKNKIDENSSFKDLLQHSIDIPDNSILINHIKNMNKEQKLLLLELLKNNNRWKTLLYKNLESSKENLKTLNQIKIKCNENLENCNEQIKIYDLTPFIYKMLLDIDEFNKLKSKLYILQDISKQYINTIITEDNQSIQRRMYLPQEEGYGTSVQSSNRVQDGKTIKNKRIVK